jgi:P27 family predicted phage terminase small subunit
MGNRGPKGKPPEMKLLQGNRGHRPLVTDGILRPLVEVPSVPKHLGREARKEWKRITVELVRYNVISRLDQNMLGMLCQAVERMTMFEMALRRRVEMIIMKNNDGTGAYVDPADAYITTTAQGYPMQCVEYQLLNKERDVLMKLLAEFGLSPAMRARVVPGIPPSTQLTLFPGGKPTSDKDGPQSFSDF